jgi:hypothetical protein
VRDLVEVIVGEPVPAQAQLAGQGPLAEPLAPGGSVLIESGRVPQQARMRAGAAALAIFWRAIWRGGPDNQWRALRCGHSHIGAGRV